MKSKILEVINAIDIKDLTINVGITCTLVSVFAMIVYHAVIGIRTISLNTVYDYLVVPFMLTPTILLTAMITIVGQLFSINAYVKNNKSVYFLIVVVLFLILYIWTQDIGVLQSIITVFLCLVYVLMGFSVGDVLNQKVLLLMLIPISVTIGSFQSYNSAKYALSNNNKVEVYVDNQEQNAYYNLVDTLYNGVIVRDKGKSALIYFPWSRIIKIEYKTTSN